MSKKVFQVVTPYEPEDENDGIELIQDEIVEEVSNDDNDENCILVKKLSNGEIGYAGYTCLKDITEEYRQKKQEEKEQQQNVEQQQPQVQQTVNLTQLNLQTDPQKLAIESESFKQLFKTHEEYFNSVAQKREESFQKLEEALKAAQVEIDTCKKRNLEIKTQIMNLNELVKNEREKWEGRMKM